MTADLDPARQELVNALDGVPFLSPWAFEYTPASSEKLERSYLRHVREADFVVWLMGEETTTPVANEVREALSAQRRLIVIRLPAQKRSRATQELLAEVGDRAKRGSVDSIEQLRVAVELAMQDEIVRALRQLPGQGRLAAIEALGRESRARCSVLWQGAGVSREQALAMADDPGIGTPSQVILPTASHPLRLLVSEIGAGKTLAGLRLHQQGLADIQGNSNAPIPIWLDATDVLDLAEAAQQAGAEIGDSSRQGAAVVLDGIDQAGLGRAAQLLNEARLLVTSWPQTTVFITSRPIPPAKAQEETVSMPELSDEESLALISRIAQRQVGSGRSYGWPPTVREAIRRPLFAVLLGTHLSKHQAQLPQSKAELISQLVERALVDAAEPASTQLERLAVLSLARGGGPVPEAELGSTIERRISHESGLLIKRNGAIAFSLPILTQWFAAQSLGRGDPSAEDLVHAPERLEDWRYPLAIVCGSFSHDAASAILRPIVERYPGFASQVVEDGIAQWGTSEEVPSPPWQEAGRRVRATMEAWVRGLGPIAPLIGPITDDGRVLPLAAAVDGAQLWTAWYAGADERREVIELPSNFNVFDAGAEWRNVRFARPGRQPTWAWRWSFEELRRSLMQLLRERALPIEDGPLVDEAVWQLGVTLTGGNSFVTESVLLEQFESRLSQLHGASHLVIGSRTYELEPARRRIRDLTAAGERELHAPYLTPDRLGRGGGWVWDFFSPERTLDRTLTVFTSALQGYQDLVNRWFVSLAPRLMTAVTLPARLHGRLSPPQGGRGPTIAYHFEALPPAEVTDVVIDIQPARWGHGEEFFQAQLEQVRHARPEASSWLSSVFRTAILEVYDNDSATKLAYGWLWDDLSRIGWVTGMPGA